MQTAGARALRDHDYEDMSREAVLLQWERKIEAAERRPSRFERRAAELLTEQPLSERRTVTITGQPTPARRRRPVMDAQLAQPDRVALWAFLLGLLLVAVAAGTAHA